jgi:hypothetical protein
MVKIIEFLDLTASVSASADEPPFLTTETP